jgi:hypothetical protein
LWWECDTSLPDLGPAYTPSEQADREAQFNRFLASLNAEFERMPSGGPQRQAAQARIRDAALGFARSALDFEERHIEAIRSYGFAEVAAQFARMARRFDPQLSDEAIFQASRNVWSMNFMQLFLGLPVQMTPAIFAYSMLYPYSDNFLDDPNLSRQAKLAFNERFRRRLMGDKIQPTDANEQKISDLIAMIEGQFDRYSYPQVYESLLAIHLAQSKSLALLRRDVSPYEVDVLGICFEKGGASVLADGYLVNGRLSQEQREFMFYYGTFTQLVDDLEDVQQDLAGGLMTVYSHTARHWPLDAVTNRTFHFGNKVMQAIERMPAPGAQPLVEIMRKHVTPLLVAQAGSSSRLYTRPYLRNIEPHSPVRFAFIRQQRKKLSRQSLSLTGLVEALAVC